MDSLCLVGLGCSSHPGSVVSHEYQTVLRSGEIGGQVTNLGFTVIFFIPEWYLWSSGAGGLGDVLVLSRT